MPRFPSPFGLAVLLLTAAAVAHADATAELNRILEENAVASTYARVCNEEPIADQLKSSTMLLLAVNGVDSKTVQLGSAKFNDVVRQEMARVKGRTDCPQRMRVARERLAFTQGTIAASRRDAPPSQ
jgi:hypothetical protein